MTISKWMTAGTVLKMMAMHFPDKEGAARQIPNIDLQTMERQELPPGQCAGQSGSEKGGSLCHFGV